eukprot:3919747-Alexandrium_andersonii.AAC.1
MRGQHAIRHWPTTQKTIVLISGETELAGVVKGAVEGLGLVAVAHDLSFAPPCRYAPIVARQSAFAGALGSGASGTWPSGSSGSKS